MDKLKYFVLIAFFSLIGNSFGQKTIDKIVAQVGDNIILLSELEGQKQNMIKQGQVPDSPNLTCELLEDMMYQFLLVNQAELDSIVISDEQVDAEMENRLRVIENQMKNAKDDKGNPITIESFYGKTRAQIKEEFRVTIKKRMQGQEVERNITQNTSVSPREVEIFFNAIPKDSVPYINAQVSYQQIAIFPKITDNDKKLAYDKLVEIRRQIVEDKKSFCLLVKLHSEDPGSVQNCGRIEASKGMMVRPFEQMAYSLKINEISPVFETEYGYHIMQLLDLKGEDYIVNHILVSPHFSSDSLDAAALRLEECYKKLRANEITWEQAVKKYSNDPATKENKGYIINPITGEQKWDVKDVNEVDPQMFLMTDALSTGDITAPSLYFDFNERKEAIRILRISERTQPHVANLKDDYTMFRQLAEEDKRQKAIDAWTKSRISSAYIRIDDEFKTCEFKNEWLPKL